MLVTALSLIESNQWWIRIWDFPRLQILFGLVLAAALSWWADRPAGRWIIFGCMLAAVWQLYRIYPYTKLATPEVALVANRAGSGAQCFSLLSLNVLQSNRNYAATAKLIDRRRPDLLLLMETDQRWANALKVQLKRYPHILARPLDNEYGMILASRLPMHGGSATTGPRGTPEMSAVLDAGKRFRVIALHPRPPVPGQDTDGRDAEIASAARRAAQSNMPVVAIGDFNDVAWSHTSKLFKRIGGYLDPRIGRGTYATFPADFPVLGWPLDQLFISPEISVRSLQILGNVGSDHLPLGAELCLAGAASAGRQPASPTAEDRQDVEEIIEEP